MQFQRLGSSFFFPLLSLVTTLVSVVVDLTFTPRIFKSLVTVSTLSESLSRRAKGLETFGCVVLLVPDVVRLVDGRSERREELLETVLFALAGGSSTAVRSDRLLLLLRVEPTSEGSAGSGFDEVEVEERLLTSEAGARLLVVEAALLAFEVDEPTSEAAGRAVRSDLSDSAFEADERWLVVEAALLALEVDEPTSEAAGRAVRSDLSDSAFEADER